MTRDTWSARVTRDDVLGCGFLVSPDLVLTCRHVVEVYEHDEWTVTFPDAGPAVERTGTVVRLAPDVDVAVLKLDREVDIAPARLATFHALQISHERRPELRAYGYPRRAGTGVQVELTALPELLAGGLVQVQSGRGPVLVTGFSGAPVFRVNDMKIVGMVAEADREHGAGRIVPVEALCRSMPGLVERIDLSDVVAAPGYAELAEFLGPVATGRSLSLVAGNTACQPPDHLPPAPLAEIEYLAVEDPREPDARQGAIWTALGRVQQAVPELRTAIDTWIDKHLRPKRTAPAAEWGGGQAPEDPPSVLVAIDQSAAPSRRGYLVQGWCVFGTDDFRPIGGRGVEPVTAARLEAHVLDLVTQGLNEVPDHAPAEPVVEFALKRGLLLDKAVDRWSASDPPAPLGWDHPVVVRDLDRFRDPPFGLRREWKKLRSEAAAGHPLLDWLTCPESVDPPRVVRRVRQPDRPRGLGLHSLPNLPTLNAAIDFGVPVMIWSRHRCTAADHQDTDTCAGRRFRLQLDKLLATIDGTVLDGLLEAVKRFRFEADDADDAGLNCGQEIVIMWDNPERRLLQKLG